MQLPFSADQFFAVIRQYNEAVWPGQVPLALLGLFAIALLAIKRAWSNMAISGILALLWMWLGLVYHIGFFTSINPLAWVFGAVSVMGAVAFAWLGVVRRELEFAVRPGLRCWVGKMLLAFALLVYPVWSTLAGHAYPDLPTFGLPCPTTIFTIGMLAMARGSKVRVALAIPILWSAIGGQAALLLDVPADFGLLAAGLLALALVRGTESAPKAVAQA